MIKDHQGKTPKYVVVEREFGGLVLRDQFKKRDIPIRNRTTRELMDAIRKHKQADGERASRSARNKRRP